MYQKIALFVLGAAVGFFIVSIYASTSARTFLELIGFSSDKGKLLAVSNACSPQTQEGDIFFLTCGGIY